MELVSKNDYVVCKEYTLKRDGSLLMLDNCNSDSFAKVYSSTESSSYSPGDIIWYDKNYMKKCKINGVEYIAIKEENVISVVKEE